MTQTDRQPEAPREAGSRIRSELEAFQATIDAMDPEEGTRRLTKGRKYAIEWLICEGWTEGDGSGHEGYHFTDYFREGVFLGPDEHGIEPVFSEDGDSPGYIPGETFDQWYERRCQESREIHGPDYDPTPASAYASANPDPYCGVCGARTPGGCNCDGGVRLAPLAEEGAQP